MVVPSRTATEAKQSTSVSYQALARAIARALADYWLRTNPNDPELRQ